MKTFHRYNYDNYIALWNTHTGTVLILFLNTHRKKNPWTLTHGTVQLRFRGVLIPLNIMYWCEVSICTLQYSLHPHQLQMYHLSHRDSTLVRTYLCLAPPLQCVQFLRTFIEYPLIPPIISSVHAWQFAFMKLADSFLFFIRLLLCSICGLSHLRSTLKASKQPSENLSVLSGWL